MRRLIGFTFLFLSATTFSFAGISVAPEIDASSAVGALALLTGGLLVLRSRRRTR